MNSSCIMINLEQTDTAKLCINLNDGLELIKTRSDIETCWIIGGSSVYEESMKLPHFHRIYLTHIDQEFKCDVYFPPIGESFRQLDEKESEVSSDIQNENDVTYHYKVFQKIEN